jgi:Ca2+-binding RTX toxin-like protein
VKPKALQLAIAVLALGAAPAHAATADVIVTPGGGYRDPTPDVTARYQAGGGEANRLTVSGDAGAVEFHDDGAAIVAGSGCGAVDEHTVRCTFSPSYGNDHVSVALGPGDDELLPARPQAWLEVDGGPGDDRLAGGDYLSGGAGDDVLTGGAGNDNFDGGAGTDRLTGGDGNDFLDGDGDEQPGSDVIDGGGGTDTVSYSQRAVGVSVDLAAGRGGGPGETDSITAVENVNGGDGPDVIRGNAGPNELTGHGSSDTDSGANRIYGLGGDDQISGWTGDDLLSGGDGNDYLEGYGGDDRYDGAAGDDTVDVGGELITEGSPARVACGAGTDSVGLPTSETTIARDCETANTDWFAVSIAPLYAASPALALQVPATPIFGAPCRAAGALDRRGAQVARTASFKTRRGHSYKARFAPRSRAARVRGSVEVRLYATDTCAGGAKPKAFGGFIVRR